MNVDRDRNMALKPSYNAKLYLPGLSNTEILILALEASQKLEWNIEEVTPEGIRFEVPFSIRSDRKSTRLNSSHYQQSRMPSSA